jgi:hypothetical protein
MLTWGVDGNLFKAYLHGPRVEKTDLSVLIEQLLLFKSTRQMQPLALLAVNSQSTSVQFSLGGLRQTLSGVRSLKPNLTVYTLRTENLAVNLMAIGAAHLLLGGNSIVQLPTAEQLLREMKERFEFSPGFAGLEQKMPQIVAEVRDCVAAKGVFA